MGLNRWTLAPSRLLGIGLALVGSGIAVGALFLPWDYWCGITSTVCVDPGPHDPHTLTPWGGSQGLSPVVPPLSLVALLGLFFALMLAFVPPEGRRSLAALGTVVSLCGVCSTVSAPVMDTLAWSDDPGSWRLDWGFAMSILGYVALLAGIGVLRRVAAPASHADDTG